MLKLTQFTLAMLIPGLLVACGSGSMDSSTTGNWAPSVSSTISPASVSNSANTNSTINDNSVYTGKTELASVSLSNQKTLVSAVLTALADLANTSDLTLARPAFNTTFTSNLLSLTINYKTLLEAIQSQIDLTTPQERSVNITSYCVNGGSIHLSGSLDEFSKTGILTATFNQCLENGVLTNDSATVSINTYDLTLQTVTDFTLIPTTLTRMIRNSFYRLEGSIRFSQNLETGETITLSNLKRRSITNTQILDINLRLTSNNTGTYLTGQLCEGINGCVIISSTQALQFLNGTLSQGQIILTGFASSKVRIRLLAGTLWMDLDSNGNNVYEDSHIYQ